MGITATELSGFLAPQVLLSLGLALISAQLMIGGIMLSLFTPFAKMRKFGRILIEDSFVNVFILSLFSVPNLVIRLAGEFGWGNADAAYENLYAFLGLGCCSIDNTSSACLVSWFGEVFNWQGMCGVPTGAGLLATVLAGYRYAFWYVITWMLVFFAVVIAITILKGMVPLVLRTIASFVGGIITNFATNYLSVLMLLLIPIFIMIPATIYLIYGLYFTAKFIQLLWVPLLLLGGFLYGLPVRLGRKWGAVLIAVTVVMYVGLPLMPVFTNSLTSTQVAQANLQGQINDYNKILSLVLQYGSINIIFEVQPRQYGPGGNPYLTVPDYARIQISGGGAPDRYIWTDRFGFRPYFLQPGTYTIKAVWWHGVPVTFNGTQTSFMVTEDDIKANKLNIKHLTLIADVYSFRFNMNGNEGTIFFPVGYRLWGNSWSNARVYNMTFDKNSVDFTFWSDSTLIGMYTFEMFVQNNTAYSELLDGAPPGIGVKWEIEGSHYTPPILWSDGKLFRYQATVFGLNGGYHTFQVNVQSIGPAAATPEKEDEDQASLDALQNPMLPKPNDQQMSDLGQYYASVLILPNIFVYIILVGFSAGLARMLKGRSII